MAWVWNVLIISCLKNTPMVSNIILSNSVDFSLFKEYIVYCTPISGQNHVHVHIMYMYVELSLKIRH